METSLMLFVWLVFMPDVFMLDYACPFISVNQ